MNPNNLVCRTCLGIIPLGKIAYNINIENNVVKNVRNIKEMIVFCMPEVDVYISVNPVICENCLSALVKVYNFKKKCMHVEKVIRSYITKNSLIEGSCVNLNNVVRHQIVESLKKKNWPPDYINNYVNQVLSINGPANTTVLPSTSMASGSVFSVNRPVLPPCCPPQKQSLPTQNSGIYWLPPPPLLPYQYTSMINHNIQPQTSHKNAQQVQVQPSHLQVPQIQKELPPRNYLRVNPALMSAQRSHIALVETPPVTSVTSSNMQFVETTPSTSTTVNFQTQFLESLNLKRSETNQRRVASVGNQCQGNINVNSQNRTRVLPQSRSVSSDSSPYFNSNSNKTHVESGRVNMSKNLKVKTGLRAFRKISGQSEKTIKTEKDDDVLLVEKESNIRTEDEVLIMNFDENDNLPDLVNEVSSPSKQIIVKIPLLSKEILKRKLTPEDITEEILSKRRRLYVNLNPSLPYLHKNKSLVVKLKQLQILCCKWCTFQTADFELLSQHESIIHRKCKLCQYKCARPIDMQKHLAKDHLDEVKATLKRFEQSNTTGFPCYLCRFIGLSDTDLRDHRLRMHIKCNESGMYKCPYLKCNVEVAIAHSLNTHLEMRHDTVRQCECPLCSYCAPSISKLIAHVQSHSLTQHKCMVCKAVYKSTSNFQKHMEQSHPEQYQGMVPNKTSDCSDNYKVTLDTLQEGHSYVPDLAQSISVSNEVELPMPSLSEFICDRSLIDSSAEKDDCVIVSDNDLAPGEEKNDEDDCMIVDIGDDNNKNPVFIECVETVLNDQPNKEQTFEKESQVTDEVSSSTTINVTQSDLTISDTSQDTVNVSSTVEELDELLDEYFATFEKPRQESTEEEIAPSREDTSVCDTNTKESDTNLESTNGKNIQKESALIDRENDANNSVSSSKAVSEDQNKNLNFTENDCGPVDKESNVNLEELQNDEAANERDAENVSSNLDSTGVEVHKENLNLENNNLELNKSLSVNKEADTNSEELDGNEGVNVNETQQESEGDVDSININCETVLERHNENLNLEETALEFMNSFSNPVNKEGVVNAEQLETSGSFNQVEIEADDNLGTNLASTSETVVTENRNCSVECNTTKNDNLAD